MSVLVTRSKTVSESVQDTVFCCLYLFDRGVGALPCHAVDFSKLLLEWLNEGVEGRLELCLDIHRSFASGIGDVDLLEDGLVHQPFDRIAGVPVEGCTVIQQVEGFREVLRYLFEGHIMLPDLIGYGCQFFCDLRLFLFQKIQRNGIVVMCFEELFSLVLQLSLLAEETFHLCVVFGFFLSDHFLQFFLNGHAYFVRELDIVVELFYPAFHLRDQRMPGLAIRTQLSVLAATAEVGVDVAVLFLDVGNDHPRPAVTAVDGAFQEMRMPEIPLSVDLRCQNGLHSLKGLIIDQRFMSAGVLHTFVGDDAFVIRVGKHFGEGLECDRFRSHPGCRPCIKTAGGKVLGKAHHRPVSRGVFFKRHLHQWGTFLIDHHSALLAASLIHSADIPVAERRASNCTSAFDFFVHAFLYFGGEIPGIELSDGAHDAVKEHPGRCFIDAFRCRDELDTAFPEYFADLRIVFTITGKTVDLVYDHIIYAVTILFDVFQHGLELRTVCRLR